jgi:hypothetical protein
MGYQLTEEIKLTELFVTVADNEPDACRAFTNKSSITPFVNNIATKQVPLTEGTAWIKVAAVTKCRAQHQYVTIWEHRKESLEPATVLHNIATLLLSQESPDDICKFQWRSVKIGVM